MRTLHKNDETFHFSPLVGFNNKFYFLTVSYTSTGTMHCHFLESCLVLAKVLFSLRFCLRYIYTCIFVDISNSVTLFQGCHIILYTDDILLISPSALTLEHILYIQIELNNIDMVLTLEHGPRYDTTCACIRTSLDGNNFIGHRDSLFGFVVQECVNIH